MLFPGSLIDNFVALLWLFKKCCEVSGKDTSSSHKCLLVELFFFFSPACSFRKLLCQIFKNKTFYRREGIWQHCWPTFQKENEKYRGQIPATGSTMSTYAVNEVVKSFTGTSNFHNQYTSVKWILSYPVTSPSSQTKSLQGTLDRQKIHSNLSKWQDRKYPNTNSQKINPNNMPWLILGEI